MSVALLKRDPVSALAPETAEFADAPTSKAYSFESAFPQNQSLSQTIITYKTSLSGLLPSPKQGELDSRILFGCAEQFELSHLEADAKIKKRLSSKTIDAPVSSTRATGCIKERWVGLVIEVFDEGFVARLKRKSSPIEEEAEFHFDSIEGLDEGEVCEGAIFDWTIGTRTVNRITSRVSRIYMRRIPLVDLQELSDSWERGNEVIRSIIERSEEPSNPTSERRD